MERRKVIAAVMLGLAATMVPGLAVSRSEGVVPEAPLQNTFPQDVGRDFDDIIASGWIEFVIYDDFAPYSWLDKGQPRGTASTSSPDRQGAGDRSAVSFRASG